MNLYKKPKILKLPRIIDSKLSINRLYKKPTNEYFINLLKLSKIKKENSENKEESRKEKVNLNKLKKDDITILNIPNKKIKSDSKVKRNKKNPKKRYVYSIKDFFILEKKNKLQKSLSYFNSNTIEKERANLESNFMRLKNNSNIFTANAKYIKNKKMIMIDKFSYDNNIYKPDRLGLFDMSDFRCPKKIIGKGIFGHIYYNHNKLRNNKENNFMI